MEQLHEHPDSSLVTLMAKQKSQTAWQLLYERHHQKLFGYIVNSLHGNKTLAEDILHDTFVRVFEKAHLYNAKYQFSTWLFTICTNLIKNEWRRQVTSSEEALSSEISPLMSPDVAMDKKLMKEQIDSILNTLSELHRDTYTLRYQQGFSTLEVAQILQISEGTVKSRLFKVTQLITSHFKTSPTKS